MSGLEKLRELIQDNWPLPEWRGKSEFADELREIADEIERDMKDAKEFGNYYDALITQAKLLGKPFKDDEPLDLREWIDKWYLPRPVIDGEPVQFGDEIECKWTGNTIPMPVTGFYIFENKPDRLYMEHEFFSHTPCVKDAKRVQHDSIEKLREDMNDVVSEVYAITNYEIIDDWLKRAEKLFKDGDE